MSTSESIRIAKAVFGIKDSDDASAIEDYVHLADIMITILKYTPDQVREFILRLSKLKVGVDIDRKLPDDCIEIVDEIDKIIAWHRKEGFNCGSPDVIVEKYNQLVSYRATLGERSSWYTTLADMSQMNRKNWRAGIFTTLRVFGSDMETNIIKKTTVEDVKNQAEMLNFINIKNQAYICYVSDRLRNLTFDSKGILEGMKEILIELRYQRKVAELPTTT